MTKELVWYEVIDMTSVVIKYPKDWFYKCGRNYKGDDTPAVETIGRFSTEEKALDCLQKWAEEKGLNFAENLHVNTIGELYNPSDDRYFEIIKEVGLYYDIDNNPVEYEKLDWVYSTSAMLIKYKILLDES